MCLITKNIYIFKKKQLKVNIKNIEEMEKFLKDKHKYKNEALELNIDMTF